MEYYKMAKAKKTLTKSDDLRDTKTAIITSKKDGTQNETLDIENDVTLAARKEAQDTMDVQDAALVDYMGVVVTEAKERDEQEALNILTISSIVRPYTLARISWNKYLPAGDDPLAVDGQSLRRHIYKTCLGDVKPDSKSALYNAIYNGVVMAVLPINHSEVIATDDGGCMAQERYVNPVYKKENEKGNFVNVDETSEEMIAVPVRKILTVNRHYNPPVAKGADDKKSGDATDQQSTYDKADRIIDNLTGRTGGVVDINNWTIDLLLAYREIKKGMHGLDDIEDAILVVKAKDPASVDLAQTG
jgi:hypothetical protein